MKRVTLVGAALAVVFIAGWGLCTAAGWLTPAWIRSALDGLPAIPAAGALFALLAADLVLPVPSTVALSAGGMAVGWPLAALAGFLGMMAGNLAGYWLCRRFGQRAFERFVKPEEAARFGRWLDRWGPAALAVSRLVPVMAETLSCMAGLARMHFGRFLAGLVIGTVPFALFFAWVGHYLGRTQEQPGWVLIISLAVPAAGWLVFAAMTRRENSGRP
jgi:membrane protein DedA with SNARE-associated domain